MSEFGTLEQTDLLFLRVRAGEFTSAKAGVASWDGESTTAFNFSGPPWLQNSKVGDDVQAFSDFLFFVLQRFMQIRCATAAREFCRVCIFSLAASSSSIVPSNLWALAQKVAIGGWRTKSCTNHNINVLSNRVQFCLGPWMMLTILQISFCTLEFLQFGIRPCFAILHCQTNRQ